MDTIEQLRKAIDALDAQIMALLDSRFALTQRIGLMKRAGEAPVEDRTREAAILLRCKPFHHGEALAHVYRTLLETSKERQKKQ